MDQEYSSKNTSINKNKLPAIYNRINWNKLMEDWKTNHNSEKPIVLDYGCGRYIEHIQKFVEDLGFEYVGYDLYWRNEVDIHECKPAVVICSNVLNVIKEAQIVRSIMLTLYEYNVPYYITVYEGDGKENGKVTSKTSYQRNEPINNYADLVKWDTSIKKKVLTSKEYVKYIK